MAEEQTLEPIIIKRKVRLPAEPHGGAWKVAYADFVTAMMAFFLLLWLLNVTTESTKLGISDYFEPEGASDKQTGSGGVLNGLALAADGALRSAGSPPSVTVSIPTFGGETSGEKLGDNIKIESETKADSAFAPRIPDPEDEEMKQFAETQEKLQQALQDMPDSNTLQDSLMIDITAEGLRIQIVDQDKLSMFRPNSAQLEDHAKRLMAMVTNIIQRLPNKVAVTGHTDSGGNPRRDYSNWELSADRADTARAELVRFGLQPDRIARVSGRADREPFDRRNPDSPRNRRISIVLLKDNLARGGGAG
ncbi:MAG: OmpA family protein [Alphaproteobacteria bacterium]